MYLAFAHLLPATSFAYIGPGGGLSALGALVALVAVVLLAFLGFVWYPLKRLRRRFRHPETPAPRNRHSRPHPVGARK